MRSLFSLRCSSPLGELRMVATDEALVGLYLPEIRWPPEHYGREIAGHPVLEQSRAQMDEYFAGRRTGFSVPLAPQGTDFQRVVWDALCGIPFGETRSYAALAAQLGRPAATRAVGAANGRNPISIIIPCHRVIATSGALWGYGGGLAAKRWLLRHEQAAGVRDFRLSAPGPASP